jgi:putative transposase
MPFWRLFYHVVWSTRDREALIYAAIERAVWGILRDAAGRHGMIVHAIGGVEDHVHLALSIPPNASVSEAIRKIKAASSTEINRRFAFDNRFSWQGDYSIHSISERSLSDVKRYIDNQRQRHSLGKLHRSLEPWSTPRK